MPAHPYTHGDGYGAGILIPGTMPGAVQPAKLGNWQGGAGDQGNSAPPPTTTASGHSPSAESGAGCATPADVPEPPLAGVQRSESRAAR